VIGSHEVLTQDLKDPDHATEILTGWQDELTDEVILCAATESRLELGHLKLIA
jgi:hypothetical protein